MLKKINARITEYLEDNEVWLKVKIPIQAVINGFKKLCDKIDYYLSGE